MVIKKINIKIIYIINLYNFVIIFYKNQMEKYLTILKISLYIINSIKSLILRILYIFQKNEFIQ